MSTFRHVPRPPARAIVHVMACLIALSPLACSDGAAGADSDAGSDAASDTTSGTSPDTRSDAPSDTPPDSDANDPDTGDATLPDSDGGNDDVTEDAPEPDTVAVPDAGDDDPDANDPDASDPDTSDAFADTYSGDDDADANDPDTIDADADDAPDADAGDADDDTEDSDTGDHDAFDDPDTDDPDADDPEPIDCTVTDWSPWSLCSAACGDGIQTRTRSVIDEPSEGRDPCPPLIEVRPCNPGPCPPVDCVVTDWTLWSPCSAICGGGTQRRTRDVLVEPAFDGAACPALEQEQACNVAPCAPVDCVVGEWTPWSTCSAICGGGSQRRTRAVLVTPANGGAACPPLEQEQVCNTVPCPPVDCLVSSWSAWSPCTAFCGGGVSTRTRTVEREPANGGASCPALEESTMCNTQPCPPPAWVVGAWGPCQENLQRRSVTCQDLAGRVVDDELCTASRPADTRTCNE